MYKKFALLIIVVLILVVIGLTTRSNKRLPPNGSEDAEYSPHTLVCELTSSVNPGSLLKLLERQGPVTLSLDVVEGTPRDKVISRHIIDTQQTGMTDLGPREHVPDDKLLIYERRADGTLVAATASMASLDPRNGAGDSVSNGPHRWALDFPYPAHAPRLIGTQVWNLTYVVTGANEMAITNVACR